MRRLRKLRDLAPADRRLLCQSALLLLLVRAALRVLPFGALRQALARHGRPPAVPAPPERIAWSVDTAAAALPGGCGCLPRALVAHALLRRAGHPAEIRLGVARDGDRKLRAHAWVESNGGVLVGAAGLEPFTPLMALPDRKAPQRGPERSPPPQAPHTELLSICARRLLAAEMQGRLRQLVRELDDWPGLLRLAGRHELEILLFQQLNRLGGGAVPLPVLDSLRDRCRAHTARSLYLTRELLRLLDHLRVAGVDVIPYKGPDLSQLLVGNPGMRQCQDLDLLVAHADLPRALTALEAAGYHPEYPLTAAQSAARARTAKEISELRQDGRVHVEVHWRVLPAEFALEPDLDRAWGRLEEVSLGARSLRALAPEDMVTVLCAHGAKHLWQPLKFLVDLAELLRTRPALDWELVQREAREQSRTRVLHFGLLLARDLLDAPVPEPVLAAARDDPVATRLAARFGSRLIIEEIAPGKVRAAQAALAEGRWAWMRFVARAALTPTLEDIAACRLPAALFALNYTIHPARTLIRWARKPWRRV